MSTYVDCDIKKTPFLDGRALWLVNDQEITVAGARSLEMSGNVVFSLWSRDNKVRFAGTNETLGNLEAYAGNLADGGDLRIPSIHGLPAFTLRNVRGFVQENNPWNNYVFSVSRHARGAVFAAAASSAGVFYFGVEKKPVELSLPDLDLRSYYRRIS